MAGKSASAAGRAKVSKTTVSVDLTGVEAGRRRKKVIPEGQYHAKVVSVQGKSFKSGRKGVEWIYEVTDAGKGKGARFWNNNTLIDTDGSVMTDALWSFRGALQALTPAVKIPDKLVNIDLSKFVGRTVAIEVGDGEDDEGRPRSQLLDIFNESELDDVEDDEDEDEEEDEEDDLDEDDEEDEDEDEDDDEDVDLDEDELD